MTIKAISLYQPWATLVVAGHKRYETRHWHTPYRGAVLIHAAKRWAKAQQRLADCFQLMLGIELEFPRGAIIGRVELTSVLSCDQLETLPDDEAPDAQEREFGDFGSSRFAWRLARAHRFATPIPYVGRQGFFHVPQELLPR